MRMRFVIFYVNLLS